MPAVAGKFSLPLFSERYLLWLYLGFVTGLPSTGALRCYEMHIGNAVRYQISEEDFQACTVLVVYSREGNKPNFFGYDYKGDNSAPVRSANCKFYKIADSKLVPIDNLAGHIATVKNATHEFIKCYCNTSPICATTARTFEAYVYSVGKPVERHILDLFMIDHRDGEISAPNATLLWDRFRASSSTASTASNIQRSPNTTVEASSPSGRDFTLYIYVGLGVLCVLILLFIVILAFVIKIRKKRYKERLAKTWEQRVREAALELEKQSQTMLQTGRKRRRDSKETTTQEKSKDTSKELASGERGSKENAQSKEKGSAESADPLSKRAGAPPPFPQTY